MSSMGVKGRQQSNVVDTQSTTTPLGAGGSFVGSEFTELLDSACLSLGVFTDVDSAINGLMIEWSSDGVNIDKTDQHKILANVGQEFTHGLNFKFFRIKFNNGPDPQTEFRLQIILSPVRRKPSSHRLNDPVTAEDDAELVRAILAGEDEFNDFRNILATRFGRSGVALFDSQTDSPLLITPSGQLNTGELVRLVGGNFVGGQPLLPHIWNQNFSGSGNNVTLDGELELNTGTTANGASRLSTFRRARFITATFNLAHLAVSTPGFANANVLRRWGVFDPISDSLGNDGVFFENNSGAYSVVRVKNGQEEDRVSELFFNAPNIFIKNNAVAVYEIYFNAGTIFFFQNRRLIHRMSSLDSAAYNSPHLRAGSIVENLNGNTVNNTLVSRGFATSRIGANSAIPEPFHITGSGIFIIKNTPAKLHRININDKGTGASQITVFNNFTNSGEIIANLDTADVIGSVPYDVELDIGLTVQGVGGSIDATIVFD